MAMEEEDNGEEQQAGDRGSCSRQPKALQRPLGTVPLHAGHFHPSPLALWSKWFMPPAHDTCRRLLLCRPSHSHPKRTIADNLPCSQSNVLGTVPNVPEKTRRCEKCKQDLILQHMENIEAEHKNLTRDSGQWRPNTAEWCQSQVNFSVRMLDLQQQQLSNMNEVVAKFIKAITEQMEVLRSPLQLQGDSQPSGVSADTCWLGSPEERMSTPVVTVPSHE
ncbi:uncharacterized protein LOC142012606 [Carettochelys insculpta]|uniref:uncharacterized protein LOC142012606 n=1 Tax=Carettochelys insculpta TaxID=44489 RepID=UPI003EC0ADFD